MGEKKNRNFLLGKLFFENTITLDGEKFSQPVRGLFPITRDITGQDEMIVSAWYTKDYLLTIDLAWPKMTPAASDLEFGVTITPDRKVVTKFGWEMAGVKKVYLDVVSNNPWMGDYKISRQGEFEEVSGSVYRIKWPGHGETTKGFLRRVSPVETNVVASVNVRNMKVDAIVWKSFAGQKYGFTLTNDKFTLLAGKH